MSNFQKITNVRLPFDKRHSDPKQNYGVHSLDIWFILKGPKGVVQYAVNFPVYLPHIDTSNFTWHQKIRGFDVGYHSPTPMYDDQPSMACELIEGGKCYYDGSSLRAVEWTEIIFKTTGKQPEEVLWKMLEDEYYERFGKNE